MSEMVMSWDTYPLKSVLFQTTLRSFVFEILRSSLSSERMLAVYNEPSLSYEGLNLSFKGLGLSSYQALPCVILLCHVCVHSHNLEHAIDLTVEMNN